MRRVLALVAGAATAALGALILGEYELRGATAVGAGVLFGLVVGEVVAVVGRDAALALALAGAGLAGAGLVWAAWIASGEDWAYVPTWSWVAAAIAAAAAGLRVRTPERRGADSPRGR